MATTDREPDIMNPTSAGTRRRSRRKRRPITLAVGTLAMVTAGALVLGVYGSLQESFDRAH